MKVLMPFPYLEIFDRYFAQMKAISERVSRFHVAYCSGQIKEEWKHHFIFHKFMDHVYDPESVGWRKRAVRAPFYVHRWLFSKQHISNCLRSLDVDLCYVLSAAWQQSLASYFAQKHGKLLVSRVRGNIQTEVTIKQSFPMRYFYLSSYCRSLKKSDLIIPITSQVKSGLIRLGIDSAKMSDPIELGVNIEQFYPTGNEPNETFTIGYAGRLTEEKGVYRLIRLAQQLPEIKFFVAGRKQANIRFPRNVKYFGRIPYAEMPKFYSKVDLTLLPSFTEGFPNVILEAYASGKPILTTKEALPSELKLFGSIGDFEHFPTLIDDLKRQDLVSIGKEARSYVEENYTWEKFGEKMVNEFGKLVKS